MIALTSGLALVIGWYRGFSWSSLEFAAAAFVVVLAIQTLGLVLTARETGPTYWLSVALVAGGWVACVWIGARARRVLSR